MIPEDYPLYGNIATITVIVPGKNCPVHVIVVPCISRVYWICTTEGSSMYSPREYIQVRREYNNNTRTDIHGIGSLYYEHVLIRSN